MTGAVNVQENVLNRITNLYYKQYTLPFISHHRFLGCLVLHQFFQQLSNYLLVLYLCLLSHHLPVEGCQKHINLNFILAL